MSLTAAQVAHVLIALGLLLLAAHAMGHLFVRLRQPRVIGELTGGLLLGPTVFGAIAPAAQASIFSSDSATTAALAAVSQLGLMMLMFASGAEMKSVYRRREQRTIGWVAGLGVLVPVGAGLLLFRLLDPTSLLGSAGDNNALLLVFSLAIAVTSIPVISRIMLDLGVIDTSFARIVLGVAVIEDVVVYIVLAIALGLVTSTQSGGFGLPAVLGLRDGSAPTMGFHVGATVLFFVVVLTVIAPAFRWSRWQHGNFLAATNPIGYHVLFLFAITVAGVALGLAPLFGAFLAGIAAGGSAPTASERAMQEIKDFSLAFFVPIYFAIVGLQLDLLHHFDPVFFAVFLLYACTVKSVSVFAGARIAGESTDASVNLALATNARGGPGIVLASVAFAAGIVSQEFYASMVMLAVVTSLIAGSWLGHIVRSGRPLRDEPTTASTGGLPASGLQK